MKRPKTHQPRGWELRLLQAALTDIMQDGSRKSSNNPALTSKALSRRVSHMRFRFQHKNPWRIATSFERLAAGLNTNRRVHDNLHQHVPVEGAFTANSTQCIFCRCVPGDAKLGVRRIPFHCSCFALPSPPLEQHKHVDKGVSVSFNLQRQPSTDRSA